MGEECHSTSLLEILLPSSKEVAAVWTNFKLTSRMSGHLSRGFRLAVGRERMKVNII